MSSLSTNLWRMSNKELNGLAQNRYTGRDIQIKLANHPYLLCRQHLSRNIGICRDAVDILLTGKARSCKWNLIAGCHLDHAPATIEEVYFNTPASMVEAWRFQYTFVKPPYWQNPTGKSPNTPATVLEHAYRTIYCDEKENKYGYPRDPRYWASELASHPNCGLELAIRMSQDHRDVVKNAGFKTLVRLNRES